MKAIQLHFQLTPRNAAQVAEAKDERELARGGKGKGEVRAGKVGKSDESLMGLGNFEEDVLLSRDADEIWSSISYYVERSG